MLHVGMNIEDKAKLCSEVHRVLRPGSLFGIYDVMKAGAGELSYPVPWATTAASSFVVDPAQYRSALHQVLRARRRLPQFLSVVSFGLCQFWRAQIASRAALLISGGPPSRF